jgi:PKD repeat protein
MYNFGEKVFMKRTIIILIFLCNTIMLFSQKTNKELRKARNYLNKKGEVFFTFEMIDKVKLNYISSIISIDNVKQGKVFAYANKKEFEHFLEYSIPFKVLPHPGDVPVKMYDGKGIWDFDTYPTYNQYETMMQTFASNYPNICKLDTIGILPSGRKLLAIKISDNVHQDEAEPEFLFSGTMHGDETTGYVLLLRLINYLATNYGINTRITNIVNSIELFICPLANPDGTYAAGNNTVSGATRYNANNVDLNRNYPDPRAGQHPDGNAWQPETVAFMNYANVHNFVMGANTHGGAEVVNFPWDTWTTSQNPIADNNWWVFVSREFADTAQYYGPSGFFNDLDNGITPGGNWYVITGGRQDYMNYYKHCREVTLEISTTKLVPENQLPNYWNYLYRSFINYIEQVTYGIRGIIKDACTNQPIRAKIWIENHDQANDSSHVYSNLPHGDYYRPIYAGTYSMTVSSPGYQPQTINNISIANRQNVVQNVSLNPLPPIADFIAVNTNSCDGKVQFVNQSQYPAGSTFLWNFGDGQTSTQVNPEHIYTQSGIYTVSLTVINSCTGNHTKTRNQYITVNLPPSPVTNDIYTCTENITLSANGSGTIYWYDSQQSNTPLATGNIFQTTITNTTTFYVENQVQQASIYGGDLRSNTNGGFLNSATKHYLIFNCNMPCKLVSVEVNAGSSGNRTIELQNSLGQVLQSVTVNIPSGISRITLNFNIPAENGLRLVGPSFANLYRNNSASTYPYNIGNYISIVGNSAGDLSYYYYFYNWEIKGPNCKSARIPVTAYLFSPPIVEAGNNQSIPYGTTTNLYAQINGGSGNYFVHWEPASLLTNSDVVNPSTVNLTSSQIFVVTVTDSLTNCSHSDSVYVFVSPPNFNVTIEANNNLVCPGTDVILSTNITGGSGNYTYQWESSPSGFSSSSPNPTVTPIETTTYYVTVSDGNYSAVSSITIEVIQLPVANFFYIVDNLTVQFTNQSNNSNNFIWLFGDGNTSTEANPIYTYQNNGEYNVVLIAYNDCGSDTLMQTVNVETSNISSYSYKDVNIFPNPFSSNFIITFPHKPYFLSIYSIDGRLMKNMEIKNDYEIINVEYLENGTYLIEVMSLNFNFKCIVLKY